MGTVLQLNPVIPKGTTVVCPACQKQLFTFIRSMKKGRGIRSNAIHPRPQARSDMRCPDCGADFALREDDEIRLYTTQGWIIATA